jgi:geranylgeranyl diphosphate synthase type I
MDMESATSVSIHESVLVSSLKSASLVRCAAELGTCIATDNADEVELHARLGWHLGLALQLLNDAAAVWPGDNQKSDIRLHKKTLPVSFALNISSDSSQHSQLVKLYYEGGAEVPVQEGEVRWALWRCGAIHYTWMVAAGERAKAAKISRILEEMGSQSQALSRLLDTQ